ncbi:MAG: glycosyltransferase [Rikenellaceae bacterium]
MRILLSNKFYYRRGGDCVCVINLEELLKSKGHEVAIFAMQHPENLSTPWSKYFPSEVKFQPSLGLIETFMRPFGTAEVKNKFTALLDDFRPDIVHLHNIHSQISPIIGEIAHNRGIRVVWTNHDYKLLCPRYDCLRNGVDTCEECFVDKHKVLDYKCMKNSLIGSILAYKEATTWSRERLERLTDAFIGPSQFMADKMAQGGFDKSNLHTICNFVNVDKTQRENYNKEDYYCFIGRLSHEKGIQTLIEAASKLPYKLKIIGGGPLADELSRITDSIANIEMMGYKQWDEIKEIVGNARFSVVPSEWYENNPMSVIESQCLGTPVLGANIGGIPELIEEGVSGMIFESRNPIDLYNKIEQMFVHNFDYQQVALAAQHNYSSEIHYNKLMSIYCD